MSAKTELLSVYESWREWTEMERDAILASDWEKVDACQVAKAVLQKTILGISSSSENQEAANHGAGIQMDPDIRRLISELIVLETRNGAILTAKRQSAEEQRNALARSSSNLMNVRKSYTFQQSRGRWHGYS